MVMEDIACAEETCHQVHDSLSFDLQKEAPWVAHNRTIENMETMKTSQGDSSACRSKESLHHNFAASVSREVLNNGEKHYGSSSSDPSQWNSEQVVEWLSGLDLDRSVREVFQTQRVTGDVLLALSECDLKHELGLSALGDRRRLALAIKRLKGPLPFAGASLPPSSTSSSSRGSPHHCCSPTASPVTHHHHYHRYCCHSPQQRASHPPPGGGETTNGADGGIGGGEADGWCSCHHHKTPSPQVITSTLMRHHRRRSRYFSSDSDDEDDEEASPERSSCSSGRSQGGVTVSSSQRTGGAAAGSVRPGAGSRVSARSLKPEYLKTAISCFYMFLVTWITAIVMVFVHDRVPDRDRHPPLPDIFLDNVPHIPWAFQLCELTIIVLLCTLLCILCFHKHRCIIVRRFAALSGTVFLLRCATMFITSLSVPGNHLQCSPREQRSVWRQVEQAWVIWQGGGLSIKGVRTCGDYMFSGHTTALTMLNFFITEYTPRRLYYIHIASWVLNMFGVFFVLAAHEHYSIDVFIAFYITSRMFLYYHSLANNRALRQRDSFRTKIWFPMFSYFESSIDGIVPNEYSNLFAWENLVWAVEIVMMPVFWVAAKGKVALVALSGVPGWKDIVRPSSLDASQTEMTAEGSVHENKSSSRVGETRSAKKFSGLRGAESAQNLSGIRDTESAYASPYLSGFCDNKAAQTEYFPVARSSQTLHGKYSPDIADAREVSKSKQRGSKSASSSPLLSRRRKQNDADATEDCETLIRPKKITQSNLNKLSKETKTSSNTGPKKSSKRKDQ